ncbi:hypothetical protein BH10BAC1_BH10BAC1_15130 [soil metagenome]
MKRTISILFLLSCLFVKAQNLVPNPSFESITACPFFSDISYAKGWANYYGSPDCYNSCSTPSSFGTPYNWVGRQSAYDGNGYAGIVTYASGSQREVIANQLDQTLIIGTKYFVSAYVSRADSADTFPFTCSANKFGFKFSTIPYLWSSGSYAPINNSSHVHSDSIITNKIGWTKVSGSFIADSAYQYIMLGNFYDNTNTDTLGCGYSLATAYYYVDMICVSTDSLQCDVPTHISREDNLIEFSVYPNPSIGIISIEFPNSVKTYDIIIYNSFGQIVVSKQKVNSSYYSIDISDFSDGVFLIKILYDNQFFYSKLLKQQ